MMGLRQHEEQQAYDVLIIGAGLSGLCALHHVRERFPSWKVGVLEAGEGEGGVWYWNRYPGARFDSESVSYAYSWDKELLRQWHWKEAFSAQSETLRYIQHVCDKHNLRDNIQFNIRIESARWQETERKWLFTDNEGNTYITRFFISCMGFLSAPTLPNIPGINDFQGESFHTSRWPKDYVLSRDVANKRVGVMGTGATGIQTTTAISKEPSVRSLTVFQRTPNWSAPLRNSDITVEQMAAYHAGYDEILRKCSETSMGFLHKPDARKSGDVSDEERLAHFEKLYSEPGFSKWLGVFSDTYTDRKANKLYSDFMAAKIRNRVNDPDVAESLIPKNHGFGTRRIPLESGYFEAFNQPNVHLVDLQKTPIQRVKADGIMTADGVEHKLDQLIFATGFDAITGAFRAIDWCGKDGRPLLGDSSTEQGQRGIWMDHRPFTYLGLTVPAMPNMFMVLGPHQPLGNATRNIEHAVDVICNLLQYCNDNDYTCVEASHQAAEEWTDHVIECSKGPLSSEVDSWMTGVNTNVAGKTVRTVARYAGSAVDFRKRCKECGEAGWKGFEFA